MNGARILISLLLLAIPAAALPVVRTTRNPKGWAIVIAGSLGAGFVLIEASLVHAALPVALAGLGMDQLAEACRSLGGHLFGAVPAFGIPAGVAAVIIAGMAIGGVVRTLRAQNDLRAQIAEGVPTAIAGHPAVLLPLRRRWAVALPGLTPTVVVSQSLLSKLRSRELNAVVRHEAAHLRHHHVRFLLLGAAVTSGLPFLPWTRSSTDVLRLSLERWADDEAAADSDEERAFVRSALSKLTESSPSRLADDRILALDAPTTVRVHSPAWGWSTVASAILPVAFGLTLTLVLHIARIVEATGVNP